MTEQPPPQAPEDLGTGLADDGADEAGHESEHESEHDSGESTQTGVPAVDRVLADVDRLDDVPLDEHLTTFERAHEALRSALDADPGDPGEPA